MEGGLDVLLIGGSGFLGRHVARALLGAGHRVTVMSRGRRPTVPGVEPLIAERHDAAALAAALEARRFDLTVDFLVYSEADIERLLLVPYAALGRYVMISTGQVYMVTEGASPPYREEDAEGPVRPEPAPATPDDHAQWTYGVRKRRAEKTLLALRGTHGMRAVALRLPILQGEGDGSLRLWAWIERMLDGGPVLLPAGGERPIRHLYAGDVAAAIVWLAGHDPPRQGVYNLAQPDVVSLRELLERVAHAAGATPRFVDASWEELLGAGIDAAALPYAGPWSSVMDPSRATVELGWLGLRTEDWLPRVVRWHLENRPTESHPGYAGRAREVALATRLASGIRKAETPA